MNYKTFWSVADAPTNSISSDSIALILFIFSAVVFFLVLKYKKQDKNFEKQIILALLGSFIVLCFSSYTYLHFFTIDSTKERVNNILNSDKVGKVEGEISNFKREVVVKKYDNIVIESFNVDSITFKYDDAFLGRFNRFSKTNENVLHKGQKVRITYRKNDNAIQKIEIAE